MVTNIGGFPIWYVTVSTAKSDILLSFDELEATYVHISLAVTPD